jgi:hypothetical protein
MFIILLLIVLVASTVVTMLLRKNTNATASSLGDFQFPTATEGRAIPVVYGTVKIGGGNTVWWGGLSKIAIKTKSGLFSKTTVGFKYLLSIQYVLSEGEIDEFIALECDGKQVPFATDDGGRNPRHLFVDQNNYWGGDTERARRAPRKHFFLPRDADSDKRSDPFPTADRDRVPGRRDATGVYWSRKRRARVRFPRTVGPERDDHDHRDEFVLHTRQYITLLPRARVLGLGLDLRKHRDGVRELRVRLDDDKLHDPDRLDRLLSWRLLDDRDAHGADLPELSRDLVRRFRLVLSRDFGVAAAVSFRRSAMSGSALDGIDDREHQRGRERRVRDL